MNRKLLSLFLILFSTVVFAAVDKFDTITTNSPTKPKVDLLKGISFNNTDSVKLPVGSNAQREASPVAGLIRQNSTSGLLEHYTGSAWRNLLNFGTTIDIPVDINMNSHKITNLQDPTNPQDGATKAYVDGNVGSAVAGPASATDNAVARYDLTTGKLIQNSGVIIDDSNNVTGMVNNTVSGDVVLSNSKYLNTLVGKSLAELNSTGLLSGGLSSINANPALFNLNAGTGEIVDYATDPAIPTIKPVSWSTFTGVSLTNLAIADKTYISIDSTGAIFQQITFPTQAERRAKIFVAVAVHPNHTSIQNITTLPDFTQGISAQVYDFLDALGAFNVSGNKISANGANLSFNKTAGSIFRRSTNYVNDDQNPHVTSQAAGTPKSFVKASVSAQVGSSVTVIDPANYDVGGTVTAVPGGGATSTVQRVYMFSSGLMFVQYGQTTYTSLANAIAGISQENFIINPSIADGGVLLAYIAVQKNCTALNASCASILAASRFDSGVGGGALATTTLQGAYNNSTAPQIITDATRGSFDIQRGSAADTDNVFRVMNGAANSVAKVTGEGRFSSSFLDSHGMVANGDVELTDISMFTCGAGNTCSRTTTSGEFSSNTAALKVATSAAVLNVSQTLATPSGVQKQGFLRIIYRIPAAVTDAQICTVVDAAEQSCVPSSRLIANGLFNSIEVPLVFGTISVGWKAKTTATNTQNFFFDGILIAQGLGTQNLMLDNIYSAIVTPAGALSAQNKQWAASASGTNPLVVTFNTGIFTVAPNCWVASRSTSRIVSALSSTATTATFNMMTAASVVGVDQDMSIYCQKTGVDYLNSSANVYNQNSANYSFTDGGSITIGAVTTPPVKGTTAFDKVYYSRNGQKINAIYQYQQTVSGTAGTGDYLFTLPNSLSFDSTLVKFFTGAMYTSSNTLSTLATVGYGSISVGVQQSVCRAVAYDATRFRLFCVYGTGASGAATVDTVGAAAFSISNTNLGYGIVLDAPISGWANASTIIGSFAGVPAVPGYQGIVDTFSLSFGGATAQTVCTAATCTIYRPIGTGFSVTRQSTNNYTLVLPRTYISVSCSGSAYGASGEHWYRISGGGPISGSNVSSIAFGSPRYDTAGAAEDVFGNINCIGTY